MLIIFPCFKRKKTQTTTFSVHWLPGSK